MKLRIIGAAFALATLLSPAARADTLFADLGERPGLERLVETAAGIFTTDDRMPGMFDETNMTRFKKMLTDQLCVVAGGGCTYTGLGLQQAHRGLHLSMRHFNYVVEDLQRAMDQQNIPFTVQNRLLARLAPFSREVVSQ